MIGAMVYSQTWRIFCDSDWDIEYTVITQEQFNRIIKAQETTASFVLLEFFDHVQATELKAIRGSRPNFNGYYYLSIYHIPKTDGARIIANNTRACVRYGNTRTGFMIIIFLTSIEAGAISLRFNQNEYVRQYNQLFKLVNGE
jgi:hypothetical protein